MENILKMSIEPCMKCSVFSVCCFGSENLPNMRVVQEVNKGPFAFARNFCSRAAGWTWYLFSRKGAIKFWIILFLKAKVLSEGEMKTNEEKYPNKVFPDDSISHKFPYKSNHATSKPSNSTVTKRLQTRIT